MKYLSSLLLVLFFFAPSFGLAEEGVKAAADVVAEVAAPAVEVVKTVVEAPVVVDHLGALMKSIGGLQGGGTLAIIMCLVQLLMFLLNGMMSKWAGVWKLTSVAGLTMVGGVVALMMQGMDLVPALLHSTTIATAQVFINQGYKQFKKKSIDAKV